MRLGFCCTFSFGQKKTITNSEKIYTEKQNSEKIYTDRHKLRKIYTDKHKLRKNLQRQNKFRKNLAQTSTNSEKKSTQTNTNSGKKSTQVRTEAQFTALNDCNMRLVRVAKYAVMVVSWSENVIKNWR